MRGLKRKEKSAAREAPDARAAEDVAEKKAAIVEFRKFRPKQEQAKKAAAKKMKVDAGKREAEAAIRAYEKIARELPPGSKKNAAVLKLEQLVQAFFSVTVIL